MQIEKNFNEMYLKQKMTTLALKAYYQIIEQLIKELDGLTPGQIVAINVAIIIALLITCFICYKLCKSTTNTRITEPLIAKEESVQTDDEEAITPY